MAKRAISTDARLVDLQRRVKLERFMEETGTSACKLEDRARVGRNAVYHALYRNRRMYMDTWLRIERAMDEIRKEQSSAA